MQLRNLIASAVFMLCILASGSGVLAQRNRKNEEPKTQVLPLPPELPMALAAETGSLDFHISPLLRTGGLSAQIRQSLNDLIRDTHGETIIKLRAFVAGAGDARRVQAQAAEIFTERKLPLPVLTILQVGALSTETAQVVIEAVVSTPRNLNPNGLAFFAGQWGSSFPAALEKLKNSLSTAGVAPDHLLTCTCFTSRLQNQEESRAALQRIYLNTAIDLVQAVRDPLNDSATCEAVAQLSQPPTAGAVVWLKTARATLVNARRLVFTGLQLTFGSFLDDAHEAIWRLQRAASSVDAIEAPVEVNAFSLDSYAGSAVSKSASVPPSTFTVQTVEGLPAIDASAGIEGVWAPRVESPVTAPE